MRNFDASMVAELLKEVTATFFMLEFQFASTYRYTDNDVSLFHGGNKYEPLGFAFGNVVYAANMSVDRVTLDIDNVSLWLSAILLGEDVRNKTAILSFGCKSEFAIIGVVELFRGFVGDWEISELKAKITLVNEFILWKKKTLRICQASCPWPFVNDGSGHCKYNGAETWCDQSWNRCHALGNDANFGGHRFLPSISEKQIFWGRLPDNA